MAERQTSKKPAGVSIIRRPGLAPRTMAATAFSVSEDSTQPGCLEVLLEGAGKPQDSIRNIFDGIITLQNISTLTEYLAILQVTPDERYLGAKIGYPATSIYTNMMHVGRIGHRAELIFSVVSIADLGGALNARPGEKPSGEKVEAFPVLSVQSTLEFHVALISEILRILRTLNVPPST